MRTDSRLAARLAAIASLGAAIIHFAVVPAHWQEWMPSGLFFVGIALCQLVWAKLVLVRTTPLVLSAGLLLNVGAIALWAVARTAGAPFGPHAGTPELIRAADLCVLLLQIYVVMGAAWVLYRGDRREPIPAFGRAVVILGTGAVVTLASTIGVASGLQHGHHDPAVAVSDHHEAGVAPGDGHHGRPEPAAAAPMLESVGTPVAPAPIDLERTPAEPLPDAHGDHSHDG